MLVEASCGGVVCPELIRFESCVEQNVTDCKFTEWTQWSRCDNDCGSGRETRTRTLLTPAYCGGDCPSMHTEETRDCESFDARADCQVGCDARADCQMGCDVRADCQVGCDVIADCEVMCTYVHVLYCSCVILLVSFRQS